MKYPKIVEVKVIFKDPKLGDFTLKNGGVSGKPFPSEGEAWAFDKGVQVMNKFMFMPHDEQLALLKQLELNVTTT